MPESEIYERKENVPTIKIIGRPTECELLPGTALTDLDFEYYGESTIPFGCRAGACGACLVEVQEGIEHLGRPETDEVAFVCTLGYSTDTHRLACRCQLNGNVTVKLVSLTAPHIA